MADPTIKEAQLNIELIQLAAKAQEKYNQAVQEAAKGNQAAVDILNLEIQALAEKEKIVKNNITLEQSAADQRIISYNNLKQEVTELTKKANLAKDADEKKQLELEAEKLYLKQLEEGLSILQSKAVLDDQEIKSILQSIEESKKKIKLGEEELANQKKITDELKKQEEKLNKAIALVNTLTGGMLQSVTSMFKLDGIAAGFGERLREVVNANQQFAATTGQLATDFGKLFSGTTGLEQFGVRSTDLQKNFSELYTSMAGFNSLSIENQKVLTENASKMANLGFSTQESAAMYNILQKSLGMGAAEIVKTQNDLAKTAIAAGIAPSKMLKDFASAMPQLAAYGKQSVQVFKELQLQAKSLGVEMSTLTATFGEAFDTFEGSADKVGKLNSILGGDYLNSVELLNATESERVELIKMAIEASGKNFDSMDKFQKKSIAASLGIKDINEANKIFGTTSAEMRAQTAIQAAEQERLEKVQKQAADTTKQLSGAFDSLMIAVRPAAEILKDIAETMAENKLIGVTIMLVGAFGLLGKVVSFIASPITGLIGLFKGAGAAGGAAGSRMAGGIARIGRAAGIASKGLLTLGATFLMIGAGIGIAAAGLGYFVASFKDLNPDQLTVVGIALGVFVVGIGLLIAALIALAASAPATAPAVAILDALGLAILLIGAGIGIAAAGMSLFVNSLGNISANAAGLGSVLASLGTIATLGTIGGIALIAGTAVIVKAIGMLRDAINELPEEKSIKVTSTMNSINNLLTTAKALKAEELKPATEFVTAVKQYYEVQATSKDAKDDALFNSLQKLLAPAKGATEKTTSQAPQTINLEVKLDGETIARKVLEINAGSVIA